MSAEAVGRMTTRRQPSGAPNEHVLSVLPKVAPGTALREGVDRIIKAGKGAIVILGSTETVESLCTGGFRLDTPFTAERLSEVAKMDGAVILDSDAERILAANVHLVPDPDIPTTETGTRHRTAERVARETGQPVVSVSESMRIVSLYLDGYTHRFDDISSVLFRANQALATLERYRTRLDEVSAQLSAVEVEDIATLRDALQLLQRAGMVGRIAEEIRAYVTELGTDGRLVQLQLDELMAGVQTERRLVLRDYMPDSRRKVDKVLAELDELAPERLLNLDRIGQALGYETSDGGLETSVRPRGYRMLWRVPRLPEPIIERLIGRYESLPKLMNASMEELDEVEGVGEARARAITEGLSRLAESTIIDHYA